MDRKRYIKVSIAIVIVSLAWTCIADPLITYLANKLEPDHQDIFRSINDFVVILIVSLVLYSRISKQQAALRKAAHDYRRLFEEIPTPMFIFDSETFQFLAVNTAALDQYSYTREEFLELKVTEIRPIEELQLFLDTSKTILDNYSDAGRWIHQNKNGDKFSVRIYTHCTVFEGKPAKQSLVINIDEKVRTEKALKEKSEELESVLESITEAFYMVDNDWNYTYVNKQYEKLQRCKREDLLGKNVWELFPYGKELRFFKEYERVVQEQVSAHFEEFNPHNNMWVSVSAYPTKNGLAIYFRDITEEKQIREKIYNDGENLRAIINNTRDLIWSVDRQFKIITGNQAFWKRVKDLTGKTEKNIANVDFEKGLMNLFLESYQRAFTGESFTIVRQRQRDGMIDFEELSFNPIYDQQKQVMGVNCFLRDITEQHEHLEQIENQYQRLREIAWIQSHRVRAPVASILGLAQLCESEGSQNEEIIPMIKIAAQQLDDVIRDITVLTDTLSKRYPADNDNHE